MSLLWLLLCCLELLLQLLLLMLLLFPLLLVVQMLWLCVGLALAFVFTGNSLPRLRPPPPSPPCYMPD